MQREKMMGARWFVATMFSSFIFTFFYGLEMLSTDINDVIFFSKMQYVGSLNISVMWLFLVASYTGKESWIRLRNIVIIYIIPSISFILVWTNEFHQLMWINPHLETNPSFSLLHFTPGAWWWVNIIYVSILFFIATFLLVSALFRSNDLYRKQIIILLIFSSLNWVATGIYTTGKTYYGINPVPLAFAFGGLLFAWGLFRYKIGEISPIAKDFIVEEMQEGLIILNLENKIVDINPMAERILEKESSSILGMSIAEVLSEYPALEKLYQGEGNSDRHHEIKFHTKTKEARSFDIRVSVIKNKHNRITGRLMFWHDISERVEQEVFQRLLLSIVQDVSIAENFKSALHKSLKIIVTHADWVFGEVWLPNEKNTLLENANASYYTGKKIKELREFDDFSQEFTFAPNMGLPGRVWASGEVEWQRDISILPRDVYFRLVHAQKANFKASMGIPVLDKGEVIAVLIFYMDDVRDEDQYMINLISAATTQLGTILAHKSAEEMMRIQSAALKASSNGIVITDRKGDIGWANPAFSELTGYSMQEIMGENPRVLKSGQHPPEFYKELWDVVLSGQSWQGEIINKRKDGNLYVEEQSITPTLNKEGEITHFIAIKKDITRRKQFEKKIKNQNTFLNNIIESIANPFYVINVKDYSIEISNAAARALGVENMKTCYALTHKRETPCDSAEHPCPLKTVLETKESTRVEHIHLDAEGIPRIMDVYGYPIFDEAGDVAQMVEYSLDITARKEAEKALIKEQEKANALLQNILPEAVIEEITEKGYVTPILYENASILFTDFRNFTETAEKLSPQELINLISHYFSFFDVIIGKYNLEKLKTIGDGYMCAGGVPIQNVTHAFDITHAALDLLSFVQKEKEKRQKFGLPYWDVRIGISTGPLIAGVVGQKKYAYDVWGEAVVTAARMEQFSETNRVNVSKATYEIIKNRFDCEYRGKVNAKHHKLDMYFVNGVLDR